MKLKHEVFAQISGIRVPNKAELCGWRTEPITIRQKQILEAHSLSYGGLKYRGQATVLITAMNKRRKCGLATPEQLASLIRKGCDPKKIKTLTEGGAARKIRVLSAV